MTLENCIMKRLAIIPEGQTQWKVGNEATGYFVHNTPTEALWDWARVNDPSILPEGQQGES